MCLFVKWLATKLLNTVTRHIAWWGACKMHSIDSYSWLKKVLQRIADHPVNRISELLPITGKNPVFKISSPDIGRCTWPEGYFWAASVHIAVATIDPGLSDRYKFYRPLMDEVCEIFDITPPTIYDWIKHGKLKHKRVRSRVFFLWNDIQELLHEKSR